MVVCKHPSPILLSCHLTVLLGGMKKLYRVAISLYNNFMSRVGLYLLGHFEIHLNGTRVSTFNYNKMSALLAYLAVESKRPHMRETLSELFWPDRANGVARANLRKALSDIRQAIQDHQAPSPLLEITVSKVQVNLASDFLLDIDSFERHIRTTRAHIHENLVSCPFCMAQLKTATELYRGDFLEGLNFNEEAGLQEWLQSHRRYYFRQQMEALQHLANYHQNLSHYDLANHYASSQLKMDPLIESAHRQIMYLLAIAGWRSTAIEQYHICRRNLDNELGIKPEPETVALFEQIKAGTVIKNER